MKTLAALMALAVAASAHAKGNFDDLPLAANSFWNGSDLSGGFTTGGVGFNNAYNPDWGVWSGWSYSNVNDTATPGFGNQYAAWAGTDVSGSGNYGVAYNFSKGDAVIDLPDAPQGLFVSNTTYAGLSMRDGDGFSKKFGGVSGDDADFFKLTIFGRSASGAETGSVDFYLADFRFADNSLDYIVKDWAWVDLTSLGSDTRFLEFALESTDNGAFGMNTPAYFAVDSVTPVPEPVSIVMLGVGSLAIVRRKRGRK